MAMGVASIVSAHEARSILGEHLASSNRPAHQHDADDRLKFRVQQHMGRNPPFSLKDSALDQGPRTHPTQRAQNRAVDQEGHIGLRHFET